MSSFRPQQPSDGEALIALAKRAWTGVEESVDAVLGSPLDRLATPSWEAHHEAMVTEACDSPDVAVMIAEDRDGSLVGFVSYTIHPETPAMSRYGEITLIAVAPSARGTGLGRRLVDHAVDQLSAGGAPVIMVSTGGDEGHAAARALYESAGFTLLPIAQYWLPARDAGDDVDTG